MFFPRASAAPAQDSGKEFEQIVERYHGKVFQLVYRYTGDYEEACDLTQDTFVRAFNAWGEFRGDSQVYTWLYRIALNLCHNQQKRIVRRQRMERWSLDATSDDDFDGRGPIEVADERPLPLTRLEGDEMRTRLREALLELPENYRVVIVLRDIEGLTYEEIAKVTDSTLEAIKSRLFRARQTLRRILEPYMTGGLESEVASPRAEVGKTEKTPVWRGAAQPEAA
ncbi:sigma-70 family RNA polymerase sigma factor [bacterium]|nr:MAG: sigma-70 family RNA polymerase sigma factor [bacterium]